MSNIPPCRWPDAGFFSSLRSRFGPSLQSYYETAARLRDLKLGDLHFIPANSGQSHRWVALLVGQRRHDRRKGPIILDMNAFKQGLLKLRQVHYLVIIQSVISFSILIGNDQIEYRWQ